jgi:hypothetical protein
VTERLNNVGVQVFVRRDEFPIGASRFVFSLTDLSGSYIVGPVIAIGIETQQRVVPEAGLAKSWGHKCWRADCRTETSPSDAGTMRVYLFGKNSGPFMSRDLMVPLASPIEYEVNADILPMPLMRRLRHWPQVKYRLLLAKQVRTADFSFSGGKQP